jgi:pimeloyl-ACP methyl ester carboxylesterase
MVPLYFGDSEKQLFGIYMPPMARLIKTTGVLICPPVAQEHIRTYMALRQLSMMIANAGFHTFKFDYFAIGDSSGESHEGSIEQWKDDIIRAYEELRAISGVNNVVVIGLRLGAALAAEAFDQGLPLRRLVLWDPILKGEDYLDEIRRMHLKLNSSFEKDIDFEFEEILGFPYTKTLLDSIKELNLAKLSILKKDKVDIVFSEILPVFENGIESLKQNGYKGKIHIVEEPAQWESHKEYDQMLFSNSTINMIHSIIAKEY